MHLVNFLRSKRQLGDHVFLGGIAVEGIVFGGDIYAVEGFDVGEIVLHVEAVGLEGFSLDAVVLAAVVSRQDEPILGMVGELPFSQGHEAVAAGHGMNVHGVLEGVGAVLHLLVDIKNYLK